MTMNYEGHDSGQITFMNCQVEASDLQLNLKEKNTPPTTQLYTKTEKKMKCECSIFGLKGIECRGQNAFFKG